MTDTKPEALYFAEWLAISANVADQRAAVVLRRLHEVNAQLLEALKRMTDVFLDTEGNHGSSEQEAMDKAKAAIAKAEGESK